MSDVILGANFLDSPSFSEAPQTWARDINYTLVVPPLGVEVPLVFPTINPGAYQDTSLDYSQWLENNDQLDSGSIVVTPNSLSVNFFYENSPYFTAWVSGGVSGTIYAITYTATTQQGRQIERTAWLPCMDLTPEPPIQ